MRELVVGMALRNLQVCMKILGMLEAWHESRVKEEKGVERQLISYH